MKVGIVGMSHLGLVYTAGFVKLGHEVTAVDKDQALIEEIQAGKLSIFETGLNKLLEAGVSEKRINFTSNFPLLSHCPVVILALDTPLDEEGDLDLAPIFKLLERIIPYLGSWAIFVVSSQVPVGTCDKIKKRIGELRPLAHIEVAYLPENLRVGKALESFFGADCFVVGASSKWAYSWVCNLLEELKAPKIWLDFRSAEMSKHALNAHLAMQVSFINEIADLCGACGADVTQVARALRSDSRIGQKAYLDAGLGITSLPIIRELRTLLYFGMAYGKDLPTIKGVVQTNAKCPEKVLAKIKSILSLPSGNNSVGIFGFSYKEGTNFVGKSAAPMIAEELNRVGAQVRIYDPNSIVPDDSYWWRYDNPYLLANCCSALLFLTPDKAFLELDFDRIKALMAKPVIFDARNFLPRLELEAKGFQYYSIGCGR